MTRRGSAVTDVADHCLFCEIVARKRAAYLVYEDEETLVFLDHRPLRPGHCLVVPKRHVATLVDLPQELLAPLFATVQRVARAVETGLAADGSFVAINNRISQSVPHLHVHVVLARPKMVSLLAVSSGLASHTRTKPPPLRSKIRCEPRWRLMSSDHESAASRQWSYHDARRSVVELSDVS